MTDRPCIPPPPPARLARTTRKRLRAIPKPLPSSATWRAIEATAKSTIPPPRRLRGKMRYVVHTDADKRLGEVEGDNYVAAAFVAARSLFGKTSARRVSGWPGKPGAFEAFNLNEEGVKSFRLTAIGE
jgi:hypothetical protein